MTTIPADYIFMFFIGALFAGVNIEPLRGSGRVILNRYFAGAILYQTVFCMPPAVYCYVVFPDWCWMYWVDSRDVHFYLVAGAFGGYYILNAMGFAAAQLAERRKRGRALTLIAGTIIFFVIFAVVNDKRLFYVGTVKEFREGTILSLIHRPLLFSLVAAGVPLACAALVIILSWYGRKLDAHWSPDDQKRIEARKRAVSLVRVGGRVKDSILESLEKWNGLEYIAECLRVKKNRAVIKPNYCGGGRDRRGTQTSPEVLSAVIDIVRDVASDADITVAESGSIFWWDLDGVFTGSIHQKTLVDKGVRFTHLGREKKMLYDFGGRLGVEPIPKMLLDNRMLIDVPVAKTHSFYVMSGALKNLLGLLPVGFKLFRYHGKGMGDREGRIFADIYRAFPPDFVIVDGIVGCEGNGPCGTPKEAGFIMTADDAIAADIVLADIMHLRPMEIPYLRALLKDGLRCTYTLPGESVGGIRPPDWKHARRYSGLAANVMRIACDHIRLWIG